jgi:DNA polymerase-3 subunit delta
MPVASAASVREQIASGTVAPCYLITGDDEIEKAALAAAFADLVEEELRAFNVERIHAADALTGDRIADRVGDITAAAQTLPMMANRRLVVVLEAENLLAPRRDSEAAERALGALEALIAAPPASTTLVFVAAAVDRRGRMFKQFSKCATVVDCGALNDTADGVRWVRARAAAAGAEIAPDAARVLAEHAGLDLRRLRSDLERLLLFAHGQKRIGMDDVKAIAGPAVLLDDWAMTNAIEAGQPGEALRQLALMLDGGAPPEKVLGQIGWVVRSKFPAIAPRHLAGAVDAVFRTDQELKRSAGNPRVLLERLVVELAARRR